MAKSEKNLWQRIKKLKLKGQIFRLESNTINGIPDVFWLINGKSIWIELKSNDVKNLGLSKYQINWHLEHFKNGGQSFILREDLSQRTSENLEIFVVREPRTLLRAYSSLTLKNAFKKILTQ
jgi:biotin operon repressor